MTRWKVATHSFLLGFAASRGEAPRPNVLFIAIDDLRDWVQCLGVNPQVKTPHLDRLAARGLAFERAYCASPSCNPSRAALMSGIRASSTGIYNNDVDWRKVISDQTPTLTAHFKDSGYYVAGAGKIFLGRFPRPDDWHDYFSGDGGEDDDKAGRLEGDLDDIPPTGARFAKRKEHDAIVREDKWKACVQAYLATISFCDAMIGRLIDGLDKSVHAGDTIICCWSDHGWHLGEKLHWHKSTLWDLTGLRIPKHVQGASLKPLLADPSIAWGRPATTTHGFKQAEQAAAERQIAAYVIVAKPLPASAFAPPRSRLAAAEGRRPFATGTYHRIAGGNRAAVPLKWLLRGT